VKRPEVKVRVRPGYMAAKKQKPAAVVRGPGSRGGAFRGLRSPLTTVRMAGFKWRDPGCS
jgi:hypothetical protein